MVRRRFASSYFTTSYKGTGHLLIIFILSRCPQSQVVPQQLHNEGAVFVDIGSG